MAHHHAALLFAVGAWLLVSRATAQVPASEGIQLDDLPVFNPERPPDFWDDANVIDVPAGGDLRAVLEPIQENWVKTVIRLAPGDHYMPQEMQLRIRMTGHTQVIGQGMNVTFLYWNAFQAVGVIEVAATVEFNSLTHVGFVTGSLAFADITNVGGNFPALPLLYQIHTETWAGCDDLDCFRPVKLPSQDCPGNYPNGCTLGLITAAQAKFARLGLLRYLWGNITGVEYTIRTIYFPPEQGYFTWAVKNAISVSIVTIVYFDSMTRLRPDLPIMENMFNWLKERQPNYAGRTDCYNPFDSDFGFTYRGNASRASNNAPCLRWDDPSIDLYNFYYPSRGNFTSVEENYCRNPRFLQFGDPGPWCNIRTGTGGITMQSCGIPECAIPKPASPEDHTRSIAGGVAAACAVLLLAVILFTWYWRKIYPARKLQAWHVKEPFETVKEIPPARLLKAKTPPLKRAPQPGSEASGSQVCKETRLLLASGVQIDSVAAADLQVKFGREWSRQNVIDTSRLVGTGSVGQVYAGTRNGEPVAYKIMNQMKPCEGMVRFMQKYVLPVVQVQHEPGFPLHHPHLLPLIDCLMFPPWYSLLALASDAGIPKYASQERKAKEQEKMREHLKQLNERHKVVIEQSAGNNGSLELSAVFLPHNPAGQPTPDPTTDSGKSFSRQVSPDNHVSTPPSAMAISGVTSAQTSMADSGTSSWRVAELRPALGWHPGSGGNQVPLKCDPPIPEVPSQPSNSSTASASAGASPPRSLSPAPGCDPKDASWEAVPALMLEPLRGEESWLETQPHQPDSPVGVNILSPFDAADDSCDGGRDKADEPSTSCQGEDATQESPHHWSSLLAAAESIKDGSGKGGSNNPRKTEGGATERGTTERDGPNHSSEGKPVTNDRKLAIVSQVIMIAPLCELGTLSALIDGRTKVPAWCIPQDLCQRLATQLAVDVRVSISEDTPEPTNSIPGNATVTIRDLPVLWQLVLKLQVCLQVVEGVMALHKAQLVHCDIKPENIFLTAKSGFQPFAVCAKIGDMDTCRSIAPGRQGAGSPRSPTGTGYGLGLNSASVDPYFTTCLKGTPGYLAPEMILQGKVAPSTDLFSLAITIAIMLAKRHRFIQYDNLHMRSVPEFSELIDVQLAKLLGACTLTDPNARPTIMQLKTQLRSQFYKTLSQATASLA